MERTLTLEPIGYLRTTANKRYEAPRQPGSSEIELPGRVILNEGQNFEQALQDLDGFSKIWLVYWFDRNDNWKPMVVPPRGPAVKRGVFATRAPYRPNPIGLSLVDLVEIKGRTIYVGNVDLLDKTPILDIKPYLPYAEAFPDAKAGWLEGLADSDFAIHFDESIPLDQRDELAAQLRISLPPEFVESPETYPLPHPYRRIKRTESGYELALRKQRIDFGFHEGQIVVTAVREL
ncbi:MAG TPA: tRNA (N6-threonylcarbamoyladenosine(37)-N6)-methyltransferase TrmO [Candidatus Kapabacteria bacterium]|nr:tRNA (N6-threonylcarbamoyladenosine(37)-N6)-methyltransferase TrmO [Candidatus Kapabacteria bacterium]